MIAYWPLQFKFKPGYKVYYWLRVILPLLLGTISVIIYWPQLISNVYLGYRVYCRLRVTLPLLLEPISVIVYWPLNMKYWLPPLLKANPSRNDSKYGYRERTEHMIYHIDSFNRPNDYVSLYSSYLSAAIPAMATTVSTKESQ